MILACGSGTAPETSDGFPVSYISYLLFLTSES